MCAEPVGVARPGQAADAAGVAASATGGSICCSRRRSRAGARTAPDVTIEWASVIEPQQLALRPGDRGGRGYPRRRCSTAPAPQMQYWQALSPRLVAVKRARYAELAAAQGVLSNAALVDLYGAGRCRRRHQYRRRTRIANDLRDRLCRVEPRRRGSMRCAACGTSAEARRAGALRPAVLTARAAARVPVGGGDRRQRRSGRVDAQRRAWTDRRCAGATPSRAAAWPGR